MMHDVFGSGVRVVIYTHTYTHTDHLSLPITIDYRDFDFMALFRNTYGNVRQKNDRLVGCFFVDSVSLLFFLSDDKPGALRWMLRVLTDGLPDGVSLNQL